MLARNAIWEVAGGVLATVLNFGTFFLIARQFGDTRFGTLTGVMSLMFMIGAISTLGAGHLIVRAVNQEATSLGAALRRYLLLAPAGGLVGIVLVLVARPLLLPQAPTGLFVAIALAELLGQPLIVVIAEAAQSVERNWISAVTQVTSRACRLCFAIVFTLVLDRTDIVQWGVLHLVAITVGASVGLTLLSRQSGGFRPLERPGLAEARDGLPFAIGMGSLFLKGEADKFLLLRNDLASDAGNYGAASRILIAVQVPMLALVNATYARFFDDDGDGVRSQALALRLTLVGSLYAIAAGGTMWLSAPLVSRAFGSSFSDADTAIRWTSVIPLLIVLQIFAGQSLTATNRNGVRVRLTMFAAIMNIALNLALIPAYGMEGAIGSTILTELFLGVAMWTALRRVPVQPGSSAPTEGGADLSAPR